MPQKCMKVYTMNTVSECTVKVCCQKFSAINFETEFKTRSGHSIEVDYEQLNQIIDQYRNVSTWTFLVLELNVCQKQ